MSKFFDEVIAAIEENEGKDVTVRGYRGETFEVEVESFSSLLYVDDDGAVVPALEKYNGITAEVVEHVGGMNEGSTYFTVWKFSRGADVCYIKFDGWYASHVGSEYEDCWEVKPVEKTIIEYDWV